MKNKQLLYKKVDKRTNEFSGGINQKFQDPAMENWATIQSLNQTCSALDNVQDKLEDKVYLIINLILALISTYFLSIHNWILMFSLLIILEISVFFQIKTRLRYRKELRSLINQIVKVCEYKKIPLPSRAKLK